MHLDILGNYIDKTDPKNHVMMPRPIGDLRYFFLQVSQMKLNPFKKQVHAWYVWDSSIKAEKMVVVTGIGGFRSIAQRAAKPLYAGSGEPEYEEFTDEDEDKKGLPKVAKVKIYAYNPMNGNREHVATGVARWDEYARYEDEWKWDADKQKKVKTGSTKLNSTWEQRPYGQLAKCAEALGLRQMWPDELGGLYVTEEVDHMRARQVPELETPAVEDDREAKVKEAVEAYKKSKAKPAQEGEIVNDKPKKPAAKKAKRKPAKKSVSTK
jgi:phage recombination protein Bet